MYIDFNFGEVLEILSQKMDCKDMTKDEIIELVPKSIDRNTLIEFYLKTGLTVGHYFNDQKGEKTLLFNRFGAYPVWDMGSGAYLFASGDYAAANSGVIDDTVDVIIEEEVQLISQTDDGKNYVIVPFGVDLFEIADDCDIDSEEYADYIFGTVKTKIKAGFDYSKYLIRITAI